MVFFPYFYDVWKFHLLQSFAQNRQKSNKKIDPVRRISRELKHYIYMTGTWQSHAINASIMSVRECRLSLTTHLRHWLPESCYHWLLWVFHGNPCYYVVEIPHFKLVFDFFLQICQLIADVDRSEYFLFVQPHQNLLSPIWTSSGGK